MTDTPEKVPSTSSDDASDTEEPSVKSTASEEEVTEEVEVEKVGYAGFNQRMLAVGTDILWIFLLITPFVQLLTNALYGPMDTRQGMMMLQHLIHEVSIASMTVQEAFQELVNGEYTARWFRENIFQAIATGMAIIPFWVRYGASPGMWLFGMRVEDATTGERLSWVQASLRFMMSVISFIPLMLGFLWMVFNKRKKAWHDMLSNTVVIRKKWQWRR